MEVQGVRASQRVNAETGVCGQKPEDRRIRFPFGSGDLKGLHFPRLQALSRRVY